MVWYGMVWYGIVWYGMVWYGMVWYGMVWYGTDGVCTEIFFIRKCQRSTYVLYTHPPLIYSLRGIVEKNLCAYCLTRQDELYIGQLDLTRKYEAEYGRLWTQCQRCQGSFHQDVLCVRSALLITIRESDAHSYIDNMLCATVAIVRSFIAERRRKRI